VGRDARSGDRDIREIFQGRSNEEVGGSTRGYRRLSIEVFEDKYLKIIIKLDPFSDRLWS
jgi:hypothetical protein